MVPGEDLADIFQELAESKYTHKHIYRYRQRILGDNDKSGW